MWKYFVATFSLLIAVFFFVEKSESSFSDIKRTFKKVNSKAIAEYFKSGEIPKVVNVEDSKLRLDSSINEKLQKKVEQLLKRYRSDYSAVVVIDNETGKILASTGYEGRNKKFNYHLPFTTTHPSASLFKIVTSAKLLEEDRISPDTKLQYRGKGTTLYKYQLKDKKTRWTRTIPFEKAFAFSNNVVFGKAALANLTGIELFDMAYKFGFNREIIDGLEASKSTFQMPEGRYNLAELASGFNKETKMSPLHAAIMAMIIANDGRFKKPTMIEKILDEETSESQSVGREGWRAISRETAEEMKRLMVQTVKKGTARGSFRRLKRALKNKLEIGGKTGSLTGGIPEGKRDWFSSFAVPVDENKGKGISIAVMNINVKKWYVKSAFLAKEIISYYFTKVKPIDGKSTLVARKY